MKKSNSTAVAEATPTPTPGTYREVPIEHIKVDAGFNNRRELGDLAELAESIKSVGLLQPLTVYGVGPMEVHVIAGHRRLAAAGLAGLAFVPCLVQDLDERGRLEALLVENLHRKDIDPLEEAEGYQRLVGLGLSQHEVAAKVGRSQAHVSKRMALQTLSPLARGLVNKGTLPLDSAVELAKHAPDFQDRAIKSVEKNYGQLENAAPYQLRNIGERAKEEARKAAATEKKNALRKKLKAEGITVLSSQQSYDWGHPDKPWKLGKTTESRWGRAESRIDMTPKEHAKFPCHAAALDSAGSMYDHREPKVIYLCTDPASHLSKEEAKKLKEEARSATRDPYAERQRKEAALRARLREAQVAREAAIREQIQRGDRELLQDLALRTFVFHGRVQREAIAQLLGIKLDALQAFADKSDINLLRAAAAAAVCVGDDSIQRLTIAGSSEGYFEHPDTGTAAALLAGWYAAVGIELSEPEAKVLAKRKSAPIPGESAEASCRACGCTDEAGCPEGCSWVEDDLCSSCAATALLEEDERQDDEGAGEAISAVAPKGQPEPASASPTETASQRMERERRAKIDAAKAELILAREG